jgi:hypothetical protein
LLSFLFRNAAPGWRRHGGKYIQRERLPIPTILLGYA